MAETFEIIDLFAGPGGLGEGFAAAGREAGARMEIRLSVEKCAAEIETLRLRAFLRSFEGGFPREYYECLKDGRAFPDWSERYPRQWRRATAEAQRLALGAPGAFEAIAPIIDETRERLHGNTILIGGPPCQAYSLVGRARNLGKPGYVPEKDERHYLYREYVRVLERLRPAAFVMENVKGMLSSRVDGGEVFRRVLDDLREAGDGYELVPLAAPRGLAEPVAGDFVVRAEEHGIPQARHRVFIVGLRSDFSRPPPGAPLLEKTAAPGPTVAAAIGDLPALRSGLSRGDSPEQWTRAVLRQASRIAGARTVPGDVRHVVEALLHEGLGGLRDRGARSGASGSRDVDPALGSWLRDPNLDCLLHHETRGHREDDLGRYLYAAAFARARGRSPKLGDFPRFLLPEHRNRDLGMFEDRFRVQLPDRPASTVTSHIAKDGHYFIHYDPLQVRSLTVREAARLQTFPDNYHFCGPRTACYHQVGNAVPPYLALQIARVVRRLLVDGRRRASASRRQIRAAAAGAG